MGLHYYYSYREYLGVGLSPGMGFHRKVHRTEQKWPLPMPFFGREWVVYLVNCFGIGNGVSFSLISLVSWVGVGDITGCSVPTGQSEGGRSATISLV